MEYIKPDSSTSLKIEALRDDFIVLEKSIRSLPNTRERSLALTKLEECLMWTTKSIVLDFKFNPLEEVSND
jgi:hypothetical protein